MCGGGGIRSLGNDDWSSRVGEGGWTRGGFSRGGGGGLRAPRPSRITCVRAVCDLRSRRPPTNRRCRRRRRPRPRRRPRRRRRLRRAVVVRVRARVCIVTVHVHVYGARV